jgi:transposase-like protein
MAGKHWAAIARAFGVDKSTLTKWSGEYPEFSHALSRARTASQAWWEDKIQQKLTAKHFQANAARLVMAGQFKEDYAERPASGGAETLIDLLSAVEEVAQRRAAAMLPGASAKPIEAVLVKDDAMPADKG